MSVTGLLLICVFVAQQAKLNKVEVVQSLRYREGPSKQWTLDLALPKDSPGKPRPLIVVIHGGGWLEGDKSSFASREHGVPGNIVDFAAMGFVAATINYRLSGEAPYPAALQDCQTALRWLRAHAGEYHIDPNRVGAYGNSAGGHLALLLGMPTKEELRKSLPVRLANSLAGCKQSLAIAVRSIFFISTSIIAYARSLSSSWAARPKVLVPRPIASLRRCTESLPIRPRCC